MIKIICDYLYRAIWLSILMVTMATSSYAEEAGPENKIEKVEYSAVSGGRVAIKVITSQPLQNSPVGFSLNNPPRIALDFLNVGHQLSKSNISADQGVLKSLNFVYAKDRTRMVLNLKESVAYTSSLSGNEALIVLQSSDLASGKVAVTRFSEPKLTDSQHQISSIDFVRGKNGEGRIIIDLSDANTGINITQKGKVVIVDFANTNLPENLQRRLDVNNFNTPVVNVDAIKLGSNAQVVIEPKGAWEQSAYQADKKFIIDIRPTPEDSSKLVQGSKPGYAGEKLSLNFQNIDVRSVLQVIADFTGFNIITSDSVSGSLTLRLKDVPWDQALDLIMQSKGLTQRKTGNVIVIAPAEEVAAKEKLLLEANQQIEELEPMRTEVFTLKYQKAESVQKLISDAKQKILSKRGSAVVDERTNTLFVQDTLKHIDEVEKIITKIDIPVKQVMIESRLVIADERFGRTLGARFGVQNQSTSGNTGINVSGTAANSIALGRGNATLGSTPDLNVNLPVANAFGNLAFSLFRLPAGFLLSLELSALETDKRGKVVSSPRVTTANQQKAVIEQGTQIPYTTPASSASSIPAVAFKNAVLSLTVTPQITPDDKIIMDLEVKKDRVGQIFNGVPSIDTQRVITQVLVANGETAVLGGIYEQIERTDIDRVPFLGQIPIIGNAFKRTTRQSDKTELLIFITPRVMNEGISVK